MWGGKDEGSRRAVSSSVRERTSKLEIKLFEGRVGGRVQKEGRHISWTPSLYMAVLRDKPRRILFGCWWFQVFCILKMRSNNFLIGWKLQLVDNCWLGCYRFLVHRRKFRSQTSDNMDRMEKQRWEEKRREEERRSKKRKSQKKEDTGARKGRKDAIHCVFPMICGSGGSKSRLAKAGA